MASPGTVHAVTVGNMLLPDGITRDERDASSGGCCSSTEGGSTASPQLSARVSDSSDLTAERFYTPGVIYSPTAAEVCDGVRGISPTSIEECPSNVTVDPRDTDLNYYHDCARFDDALSMGSFTLVRALAEACAAAGKVELHEWRRNETTTVNQKELVVVKRVPVARLFANKGLEKNERLVACGGTGLRRSAEDTLTEIGIYRRIFEGTGVPPSLLRMHAVFQREGDVWLVLEHADEGDLLGIVQAASVTPPPQFGRWAWQLLQAVGYLHGQGIGHRDISLENILVRSGSVRLMDFGQSVRTCARGSDGELTALRYFGPAGKPYYRAPECHVPAHGSVQVVAPAGALPGAVVLASSVGNTYLCEVRLPSSAPLGGLCVAETWGYEAAPSDIFAAGVCIFVMAAASPPWRQAVLSDPHFKWVHRQGIAKLLQAWQRRLPSAAEDLIANMLRSDSRRRPTAEACLIHSFLAPFREEDDAFLAAAAAAAAADVVRAEIGADPYGGRCGIHEVGEDHWCGVTGFTDALNADALSGDFYAREEAHRSAPDAAQSPCDAFVLTEGLAASLDVCCRLSSAASDAAFGTEDCGLAAPDAIDEGSWPAPPPLPLALLRGPGEAGDVAGDVAARAEERGPRAAKRGEVRPASAGVCSSIASAEPSSGRPPLCVGLNASDSSER